MAPPADIAIACDHVWKSYRIYQQRSHTLKERVLSHRNRYEELWALKDVDLQVPRGTSLGVIGANGSGKSTLLKTIARILAPNRGAVAVNGSLASLLELGIGFHPDLTGRENVYLSGSLLGRTRREIEASYDEIVEFAGIENFMDVPVKNYSTGMFARLAFALAVSVDPDVLLVDEVLAVGDEGFQLRCFERIAEFRAAGKTIVLVSHSLESIRSLCEQAIWLDQGAVRARGISHDVVAEYLAEVHGHPRDSTAVFAAGSRYGSGAVVVTDVAFLDEQGQPAGTFRTSEAMTIRVEYEAHEELDDVACTVGVYRAEDLAYLFGQNTRQAGIDLKLRGRGVIEFHVPQLPLLAGSYVVSLGFHNQTGQKAYDWHERRYSFIVFANPQLPRQAGAVHFDCNWRMLPTHAPA